MASQNTINDQVKSVRKVIPTIYAYTTPEIARHDGWTKIGYTEQTADKRVGQQTHTADVETHLEWQGNAIYDDGSGDTFRDEDFHRFLARNKKIERTPGTEWFHITGPVSHDYFNEFRTTRGILSTGKTAIPYNLRDEQQYAVSTTADYAKLHDQAEFLWNAKPRFGKTLTAYDLCKQMAAKNILIVTNRPAIANSWYEDYKKFLGQESGYYFVSHVDALANKEFVLTREQYTNLIRIHPEQDYKCIEFVSLQDLKGSSHLGGEHDKLVEISDAKDQDGKDLGLLWDVLIIDEAHEGVDTYKTDVAFNHIRRKFTLHLSGTPFRALANDKFPSEAIYNWTYADEQDAKRNWSNPDIPNPYANLPQLSLFTYQMSEVIAEQLERGIEIEGETEEFAFNLNDFFMVADGKFVREKAVDQFLDALTEQEKYPFSTEELRNKLKHTFWLLNRVDSARALMRKLNKHPVFKDYYVVLAAGNGKIDDNTENVKAFDKVRNAIEKYDKTITLSVGQLTTGVTIPEWTAVLMLSDIQSPSLYMQAAFRAQNPCLFHDKDGGYYRKDNAYVFDFDPVRTLKIVDQFANGLSHDTTNGLGDSETRKEHIRDLLNFFPVIGEDDDGKMIELDAEKVLSIPRTIKSKEVVRRGFMSNFLFQNISNIFSAPQAVIDILNKLEPQTEPKVNTNVTTETKRELNINNNGNVEIPNEQVIGTATNLFGEKIYGSIETEMEKAIYAATAAQDNKSDEDKLLEQLKAQFHKEAVEPIIGAAKQAYGTDMRASQQKKLENKLNSDAEVELNKKVDDFKIKSKETERQHQAAVAACKNATEVAKVNTEYNEKRALATEELKRELTETVDALIHSAGETVVRTVETEKKEQTKKTIENSIRDHLRGFSRTIPSFLMAYGTDETTLENFDTIIPGKVFLDVTSVTLDQFRFLRDGGPYKDAGTGEEMHFDGHLFDPLVFNDSIKEFLKMRAELADYFDESKTEDIFDYIPPQKTNQIFTPRWVVVKMVDMLAEENPGCFDNPDYTFADLYMKSGLYITEIVKRLYNSPNLKKLFPNDEDRIRHIVGKQVFGAAPTEIIYRISTHYILGFSDSLPDDITANFVCADTAALAKAGKLEQFVQKNFGKKLNGTSNHGEDKAH